MKIQNCWNWQTSTKTIHSFCKMIGQLLQTELDHCTTVSYTASACSSELTASVVSWTASALKCTQQTARYKKSQSNLIANMFKRYAWVFQTDNNAQELCKRSFWDNAAKAQRRSNQPSGEPRDNLSILPRGLDNFWKTSCTNAIKDTQALKRALTSLWGISLLSQYFASFGRNTSGRRRW